MLYVEFKRGGSSESEYTFTGTLTHNATNLIITGSLNKVPEIPDTGIRYYVVGLGLSLNGICSDRIYIMGTGPYTLTLDFEEPISGNEIPAICILTIIGYTYTIIPVTFIQQTVVNVGGSGGSN